MHHINNKQDQVWKQKNLPCPKWLSHVLTVGFMVTMLVLCRAESVTQALQVYKAMFGLGPHGAAISLPLVMNQGQFAIMFNQPPFGYVPDWGSHLGIVLTIGLLFFVPDSNTLAKNFKPSCKWALALSLMFVYSVLHFTQVTAFLYFQF